MFKKMTLETALEGVVDLRLADGDLLIIEDERTARRFKTIDSAFRDHVDAVDAVWSGRSLSLFCLKRALGNPQPIHLYVGSPANRADSLERQLDPVRAERITTNGVTGYSIGNTHILEHDYPFGRTVEVELATDYKLTSLELQVPTDATREREELPSTD